MKANLKWNKQWLNDKSGFWYSAKVQIINWEYVVEDICGQDGKTKYIAGVFMSKTDDDIIKINKTSFTTEMQAKNACERHFQNMCTKFSKQFLSK